MKFERQFSHLLGKEGQENPSGILSPEERSAIEARADFRQRSQGFKRDMLNLGRPDATEEIKGVWEHDLQAVFSEAGGETHRMEASGEEAIAEARKLEVKGESRKSLFPNLSAYLYAESARLREASGKAFEETLRSSQECASEAKNFTRTAPADFLADGIILGMQIRKIRKTEMPAKEKIAAAAQGDPKLLADCALALTEIEREEFLKLMPEEKRELVSRLFDAAVSEALHQSLMEKGSAELAQRSKVRLRLFHELKQVVESGDDGDKAITKILARSVGELGEDTRQLILEIIRDEYEGGKVESKHLPRVIKVFLDNFEDWRGNDIVLRLAGEKTLNRHLATFLIGKLIKNGYLPKDIKLWQSEQGALGKKGVAGEKYNLEVIRKVIADLGVIPSRDILSFISDDKRWKNASLDERVEKIRASQKEFESIHDNRKLAKKLHKNAHEAMIYYLLHGGDDRFNLINKYDFSTFKEMIGLIADLKIHENPLKQLESSLAKNGISVQEATRIIAKLKSGKFPLENEEQAAQEISFDVSKNATVKNANFEIGRVLGRQQLGVVMLFPIYREYLEKEQNAESLKIIEKMKTARTFSDRLAIIDEIESKYADFRDKAMGKLKDNWRILGEKMVLELSLDQILGENSVPVRGEDLLPRLDAKRIDLRRIKKDLLVVLKGTNKEEAAIRKDILKKKKARENLMEGLEKQKNEAQRERILEKIKAIETEMRDLEKERLVIADKKTIERFEHMTEEEKKSEIEKLGNEILALTEKSPSAIFTYITMQALGEERLRESDIALVQEMESHLQGPFQSIVDATTYQKPATRGEEKKRVRLRLEYLDKTKRFMNMVRFADSKICCFSSNNYNQSIQYSMPNKFWVASINADPLSFVISMEMPKSTSEAESQKVKAKENLGFIFGNFGIDENGGPTIMLNGIYYAPGLENQQQTEIILSGVEKIFSGMPIKALALAEQHGGSLGKDKIPQGYVNDPVELIRLRALDDGSGDPETKIYDDLSTGGDLNKPHDYGGHIWHKRI